MADEEQFKWVENRGGSLTLTSGNYHAIIEPKYLTEERWARAYGCWKLTGDRHEGLRYGSVSVWRAEHPLESLIIWCKNTCEEVIRLDWWKMRRVQSVGEAGHTRLIHPMGTDAIDRQHDLFCATRSFAQAVAHLQVAANFMDLADYPPKDLYKLLSELTEMMEACEARSKDVIIEHRLEGVVADG